MVAAAFTQTVILKGTQNNRVVMIPMTVSDVANAYAVGPDGNAFVSIPSDQPYAITDIIVITGGTDTNFQDIYANSLQTGLRISNKSNLNTANFRQFQGNPVVMKAGALLRFQQVA